MPTVAPRLLLIAPAFVAFVLVTVLVTLLVPVPAPLLVGLVLGLAAGYVVMMVLDRRAPEVALRALDAWPLPAGTNRVLESLVESVCASHGVTEPQLYLVESRAPDAAVAGKADDTRLVVTTGALRQFDRLELEAVVARELVQFGDGIHAATILAAVGIRLPPLGAFLRPRLLDDRRLARSDIEGVQLTRYPPALRSAFEKAAGGPGVPLNPATRHLWLIGPLDVDDAIQPALGERIDTLGEL